MKRSALLIVLVSLILWPAGLAQADYQSTIQGESSLQSYWRLGESSGTTLADQVGGQDLTVTGGALTLGSGSLIHLNPDTAVSAPTGYGQGGDVYDFNGLAPFSVEAWVKPAQVAGYRFAVSKWDNPSRTGWGLYLMDAAYSVPGGERRLIFVRSMGAGLERYYLASGSLPIGVGEIAHIAYTFDGTRVKLFVNGVRVIDSTSVSTLPDTTAPIRVAGHPNYPMKGVVDEAAIYNAVLSEATILAHYQAGQDTQAPNTQITSAPAAYSPSSSASFSFSSPDSDVLRYECRLDSGSWSTCTDPHTYTSLADGAHQVEVRAIDSSLNPDPSPAVFSWTVDTQAPQTSIQSAPGLVSTTTTAHFEIHTDETATLECRLDGGPWEPCASPRAYTQLSQGAHSFEVRATDQAGNTDSSPASHTWSIDSIAPESVLTESPAAITASALPRLSFSSEDPTAYFECRLDGGAWFLCISPITVTAQEEGEHLFEVRAIDVAGNVEGTPAQAAWARDSGTPETTISSGPSAFWPEDNPRFWFSSGDNQASFECRADNEEWRPCSSPAQVELSDGPHSFSVRAVSRSGVVDSTPAVWSFVIDTKPPRTVWVQAPAGRSTDPARGFAVAADEPQSLFFCSFNRGPWVPCSEQSQIRARRPGKQNLRVRAVDLAGNQDPSYVSADWEVQEPRVQTQLRADSKTLSCNNRGVSDARISYRWLRDGRRIPGAVSPSRRIRPQDSGSRLACQAVLTYASGARRIIASREMLLLGRTRLTNYAAGRRNGYPWLRFRLNRPSRVLIRLWCAKGCEKPVLGPKDHIISMATVVEPPGLRKKRRVLLTGLKAGENRFSLNHALLRPLPRGTYKMTVRLARLRGERRHQTSNFLVRTLGSGSQG